MKGEVLDKVIEVGCVAADLGIVDERMREAVADSVEDGVRAAKRAVKQGCRSHN